MPPTSKDSTHRSCAGVYPRGACFGRGNDESSSRCAVRSISAMDSTERLSPAPASARASRADANASSALGPIAAHRSRSARSPSPRVARAAAMDAAALKPAKRKSAASRLIPSSPSNGSVADTAVLFPPAVSFPPPFFLPPRFFRWSCASSRNCGGRSSSSQFKMSQSRPRFVRRRFCSLNPSARSPSASTAGFVAAMAAATALTPKPFFSSACHVLRSTSSGSTSARISTTTTADVPEPPVGIVDPGGIVEGWAPRGVPMGPRARRPCTSSWLDAVMATTSWLSTPPPPPRPPPPRPPPLPPRPPRPPSFPPPLPPEPSVFRPAALALSFSARSLAFLSLTAATSPWPRWWPPPPVRRPPPLLGPEPEPMDVRDHAHAHTTRVAALPQMIKCDLFFELIDLAHVSSPQSNNFGNKYASRACFSYCYSYVIGWCNSG